MVNEFLSEALIEGKGGPRKMRWDGKITAGGETAEQGEDFALLRTRGGGGAGGGLRLRRCRIGANDVETRNHPPCAGSSGSDVFVGYWLPLGGIARSAAAQAEAAGVGWN